MGEEELVGPPADTQIGTLVTASSSTAAFLSGTVPTTADGDIPKSKVGAEVTTDEAAHHARSVGLNLLAVLKHGLGDLDRVRRIVKLLGMVNAVPDYREHSKVAGSPFAGLSSA